MTLSYVDACDLILEPFQVAWGPTGFPVVYTDVPGNPPPTQTVWARVILRHVSGGQVSLAGDTGKSRQGSQGSLYIQVFAPVGQGSQAAYDAAFIVAQAYRGSRNKQVWFRNVRINEVGTSGAFEQINVVCEFQYDSIG